MAIDASIYGQIRPFTMADPMETKAKALQIQAAEQQMAEQKRRFQMEDDLSSALSESGGDFSKASTLLAQRGRGQAALSLQDKANAQRKAQIEEQMKIAEAMGSDAIALDSVWRNALSQAGGNREAALATVNPVYSGIRQKWAGLGHSLPEQFDPDRNFAGIGQAKEMVAYLGRIAPSVHMTDAGGTIVPTNTNPAAGPVGPLAGAGAIPKTAAPAAPTELSRLMAERDALPAGDPRRARYDEVIKGYKAGKGDTNVTVTQTGPMLPGKEAGNKIDTGLLDTTRSLMQLDQISGLYKPEFQRFSDKVGFAALKVKDSTTGLTNKEKEDLTQFSQYRRTAFNSLNEYIKSITGAAMSEAEAERIRKSMPDPGDGIFGGDSPTEFRAKLDAGIADARKAVARFAYLKRNGMSLEDGLGKGITLQRMPQLMNERGKEIEASLKQQNPNVDATSLDKAVRRQLALEFGLVSD